MNRISKKTIWLPLAVVALIASMMACHRPWHNRDQSEFILKHLDRKVSSLDLNETQQASYDKLRTAVKADLETLNAERKETGRKIKAELGAENPDMKKIAGFAKEGMKKHPEVFERQIDRLTDFYSQLNKDQQKEVRETIEKRLSHIDE